VSSVILFKTGNRVLILIFTAIVRSLVRCLLYRAQSEMDISYNFTHDPLRAVTHTACVMSLKVACLFEDSDHVLRFPFTRDVDQL